MAHPILHGCFHSLASLGYIPFALTSVLISSSTPFLTISPVGIILLALVPSLTLFPLLCLFYRRLERFDTISLTVQRARIYIMVAGSGLCVLVAAHLIMVHIIGNSHNTTYNRMLIPHTLPLLQARDISLMVISTAGSDSNNTAETLSAEETLLDVPLVSDGQIVDQSNRASVDTDNVGGGLTQLQSASDMQEHRPLPVSSDNSPLGQSASTTNTTTEATATTATATTATIPVETETGSPKPHSSVVHIESRSHLSLGYNLAGVHLLLFLLAQTTLLILLAILFLGVLIMTEFILDREDEDVVKARWYFWGRVLGVLTATVVSAVHGSFLSAYVLLDGQSDCIAKAAVGTILFYWVGMIVLMNRTPGPLPY